MRLISTEVEGLDELHKQMESLVSFARNVQIIQTCARHALKPMLEDIKNDAPRAEKAYYRYYSGRGNKSRRLVEPGTLQESIAFKRIKLSNSVGYGIYIKPKAFYWRFIEGGTPTIAADPFLRSNYEQRKHESVERFKERYRKYLKQTIKKQQVNLDAGT